MQSSDPEVEALRTFQNCDNNTRAEPASEPQHAVEYERLSEDGYEIMNGIGAKADSPKTNMVVLKESSSQQAVNLILSFGGSGDSQVQVLDPPLQTDAEAEEPFELVHRVRSSTSRSIPAHHSDSALGFPSFTVSAPLASCLPFFLVLSCSPLRLNLLPVKAFGGAARGFWKTLWVV